MALQDHISQEELDKLNAKFEAEDTQAESDPESPESERVVSGHNAFGDHGVMPRELDGVDYSSFE